MFDIHSPEQIETLLTQMQWLDGADAIYEEGRILAHIRVADSRVDMAGVSARARLLRPLRRSRPSSADGGPIPAEWVFGATWDHLLVQPWRWSCAYPGWVLHFARNSVANLLTRAALPPGRSRVRL
ncbi:MAG: hypothetical protein KAY24_08030 [Candidatus Eisenbacteria sp.]|nr:hypothetical protein [Candidatus Eisenbacteria bacterium]